MGGEELDGDRSRAYAEAIAEIRSATEGETDPIANLANTAAILFEKLPFSWIGFYRVVGAELVLGPFQGKSACVRVARGRGVCGAAWERGATVVVPDVHAFAGHIACDPESRSEIVIPLRAPDGVVWGLLDVDSREVDDFGAGDRARLEEAAALVEERIARPSEE